MEMFGEKRDPVGCKPQCCYSLDGSWDTMLDYWVSVEYDKNNTYKAVFISKYKM